MSNPKGYTADQIANLTTEELLIITGNPKRALQTKRVASIMATMKEMGLPESVQETVKALIEDFQP